MAHSQIHLVGICGSVRKASYNQVLLRTALESISSLITYEIAPSTGAIPPFDPESTETPQTVQQYKEIIAQADGLLIATPEYNFSFPGTLKNTIDWLSRPPQHSPLNRKPVALLSASQGAFGGIRAQLALRDCLYYFDCQLLQKPEILVPFIHEKVDQHGKIKDEFTIKLLQQQIQAFVAWIKKIQIE